MSSPSSIRFFSLSLSFLRVCVCACVSLRARVESKEIARRVLSCACDCKAEFDYSRARAFQRRAERECVPFKMSTFFSQNSGFFLQTSLSLFLSTRTRRTHPRDLRTRPRRTLGTNVEAASRFSRRLRLGRYRRRVAGRRLVFFLVLFSARLCERRA